MNVPSFKSEYRLLPPTIQRLKSRKTLLVLCFLLVITTFIMFSHQIFESVSSWKQFNHIHQFNRKNGSESENKTNLDLCPITPKNLAGVFIPDLREMNLDEFDEQYENVFESGGYYKPSDCVSRDRVAIVVPARKRDEQIPILLKNLHPLLMHQQIEYQIFVIQQAPGYLFNLGALFNVGFIEAMKFRKWDCFIFHDVDTIPIDDRNLYVCPRTNPRHMGAAVDKFNSTLNKTLIYPEFFGIVSAFTVDQYRRINGHANSFWGWGGEDNDATIEYRVKNAGYVIERYPLNFTRYISLRNRNGSSFNPKRLYEPPGYFEKDGLNSIRYHIKNIQPRNTFTSILVDFIPQEMGFDPKNIIEKSNEDSTNKNREKNIQLDLDKKEH